VLYQDVDIDEQAGLRGSRRFEQEVLDELERAYDRMGELLGLRPTRRLDVVVYDPGVFDELFAGRFRFPAGGFYHGVIRIRGSERLHEGVSRLLHHELVHAALDAAAPSTVFPAWLNEGVAEWFAARAAGKRNLSSIERAGLARAREGPGLFPLASLSGPGFGRFEHEAASVAYLQSYAMIEYLARTHGERALRELCTELVRTRDLERTLRRVFRDDLPGLEAGFRADLG
jgi:hypothetical protein